MISYSIQKKWKYLAPIIINIPDGILKFAAKEFIKLQKRESIGNELPKRIIFFVTKYCNLRCKHCFYVPHVSSAQEISLSQIKQLAFSTRNHLHQVILTGGEPFLREDFLDIVLSFAENGCKIINIDTNGILIERIDAFLKKVLKDTRAILVFQISLDGPPPIHDQIRGVRGAAKKTLQTISLLSDYYQKYPSRFNGITVSTSINRLNREYLSEVIEKIKPFNNVVHLFNFTRSANLHTFGAPEGSLSGFDVPENIILNIDEMKDVFEYLDLKVWKAKNNSLFEFVNREIMMQAIRILEKKSRHFSCLAGKTEVVIYPEGEVGICEMLKPVGNLKETEYDLIKFYKQYKEKFQAIPKCVCTHDCSIMSSIKFSPELLVEMVKKKKAW